MAFPSFSVLTDGETILLYAAARGRSLRTREPDRLDRQEAAALASDKVRGATTSGIIMLKQLRFAAILLISGAAIVLATTSVWAFSQQTVTPNGNYNFNYGLPDDKAKLDDSTTKSDSSSPTFHFNIESGQQTGPFGFHGPGDSDKAPDFYTPHGRGD
jgi:hypothetical protein